MHNLNIEQMEAEMARLRQLPPVTVTLPPDFLTHLIWLSWCGLDTKSYETAPPEFREAVRKGLAILATQVPKVVPVIHQSFAQCALYEIEGY